MKKDVKRTVYLILLAIILFSASMSIPMLYNSKWKEPAQGGAAGLMIAAVMSVIPPIVRARRAKSK
jgi:hypothetical protein